MADLAPLLERLRAATGPDQAIDLAIYEAFRGLNALAKLRYTGSLDAAMTLIRDDHYLSGLHQTPLGWSCCIADKITDHAESVDGAPTAPLAVATAALLARADAADRPQERT